MCAQHCLNFALQGPYFSAIDLAELARKLDEDERQKMAENGMESPEYRRFMQQPSGNMDDTGFFSVQVISSALALWSLELIPLNSSDPLARACRHDPTQVTAYIFHMENHWFCIRRFNDVWFNLNSLLKRPKYMSSLYLTEYLQQMEQEGYMVFIVKGELPQCIADQNPPKVKKSLSTTINAMAGEGRRLNSPPVVSGQSNNELDAALKLSLECFSGNTVQAQPTAEEIRNKRLAFFSKKD